MTIIKQGNIYHAQLAVPKDVQLVIGKKHFRKSLKTPDLKEAKRKEPLLISTWKEKIEIARGNGGDIKELSRQYKEASNEGKDALEEVFQDMVADDYGKVHYSDLTPEQNEKALYKYKILTGQKVKTDVLLNDWLVGWDVNIKGREQGGRYVRLFCNRFKTTDMVTKSDILEWCIQTMEKENLSRKTIRCRLSPCKIYWEFLQLKGYVDPDKNPFVNITLAGKTSRKGIKHWEPFTVEEINKLHIEIKKKSNIFPELYHLFEIAKYTGARIEEICQIKTTDISDKSIRITNSKTQAGIREVPIHSQITSLIKDLKVNSKDTYLIGNLKTTRLGQRSAHIGKKFGRIKTRLGFGETKVFHSIRKTVVTQLEQAGIPESITADIVGHEKKTMTYGLYSGGSSMAQKIDAIEKINYQ